MKLFKIEADGDYPLGPAKGGKIVIVVKTLAHSLGGGTLKLMGLVDGVAEDTALAGFPVTGMTNEVSIDYGPGFEFVFNMVGSTAPHVFIAVTGT